MIVVRNWRTGVSLVTYPANPIRSASATAWASWSAVTATTRVSGSTSRIFLPRANPLSSGRPMSTSTRSGRWRLAAASPFSAVMQMASTRAPITSSVEPITSAKS